MNGRVLTNAVFKEQATIIASAADTDGAYNIIQVRLLPDGANGLHFHRLCTQTFTALDGPLHIHLGGKEIVCLHKGESYTVKPLVVHGLFNPTKSVAHCQVVTTPGLKGYEQMIQILSGLAKENQLTKKGLPKDYSITALLMEMGDMYFIRAHTFFYFWVKWKAKLACNRGIDKELVSKHCSSGSE